MRIIYLSTGLSDDIFNEICDNSNRFKPTFSGVGFDRNIASGLAENATVEGISLYPIPSFGKYKKLFERKKSFSYGGTDFVAPGIVNLPIIKEFFYGIAAYRIAKRNIRKNGMAAIVVSGAYRSLLRPANMLKRKLGCKIVCIVPDLPELMMNYRSDYSRFRRILNKIDAMAMQRCRKCIDGYVFLSPYMDEAINVAKKPSIIMDGLIDGTKLTGLDDNQKVADKKIVMYAGKINKKFGADILVDAFLSLNMENTYLYLCGDGDYAEEVKKIVQENERIKFFGRIDHEEVIKLEKEATLLVEPRPTDDIIVKMSFPSKIIEYMSSGTPVLTTNLPCFSDEYKNYQYRINDETREGIAKALYETLSLPACELESMGRNAYNFILENKTVKKQCERVMKLITDMENSYDNRE